MGGLVSNTKGGVDVAVGHSVLHVLVVVLEDPVAQRGLLVGGDARVDLVRDGLA